MAGLCRQEQPGAGRGHCWRPGHPQGEPRQVQEGEDEGARGHRHQRARLGSSIIIILTLFKGVQA